MGFDEPHAHGNGFDPAVCQGCEHHQGWLIKRCGLCLCPTAAGLLMDRLEAPPVSCPRLAAHGRSSR